MVSQTARTADPIGKKEEKDESGALAAGIY
jgi:hypothetical protein